MKKKIIFTNNGEIDSAIPRRWTFEIDAASVKTGIRFAYIVDHQATGRGIIIRHQNRAEESSFAQDVLVGPMSRPVGVFISGVIPVSL